MASYMNISLKAKAILGCLVLLALVAGSCSGAPQPHPKANKAQSVLEFLSSRDQFTILKTIIARCAAEKRPSGHNRCTMHADQEHMLLSHGSAPLSTSSPLPPNRLASTHPDRFPYMQHILADPGFKGTFFAPTDAAMLRFYDDEAPWLTDTPEVLNYVARMFEASMDPHRDMRESHLYRFFWKVGGYLG